MQFLDGLLVASSGCVITEWATDGTCAWFPRLDGLFWWRVRTSRLKCALNRHAAGHAPGAVRFTQRTRTCTCTFSRTCTCTCTFSRTCNATRTLLRCSRNALYHTAVHLQCTCSAPALAPELTRQRRNQSNRDWRRSVTLIICSTDSTLVQHLCNPRPCHTVVAAVRGSPEKRVGVSADETELPTFLLRNVSGNASASVLTSL